MKRDNVMMTLLALGAIFATACTSPGDSGTDADREKRSVDREETMPSMVELFSPTCPSCLAMKPVLEELVRQCDKKGVHVMSLDISAETNERYIDDYDVRAVPTFLFLDENGVETARLVGLQTEDTLKQSIAVLRGEECPGVTLIEQSRKVGS